MSDENHEKAYQLGFIAGKAAEKDRIRSLERAERARRDELDTARGLIFILILVLVIAISIATR